MTASEISRGLQSLAAISPMSALGTSVPKTAEEGLRRVTQEFESVFISELLKQMRKPEWSNGLFGEDRTMKIYAVMRDESFASEMSKAGGLGIGSMLYAELRKGL